MSQSANDHPRDGVDSRPSQISAPTSSRWFERIQLVPAEIVILLVRCYQLLLSPLLGRTCRFHPSCSQFFILAVRKYGLISGSWRGVRRISRCHPWNPGGYDPP
jgi:putative membrane protein insertion efficiency factor